MKSIKTRLIVLIGFLLILVCAGLGIEAYNTAANALIQNSKEMMPKFAAESSKSIKEGVFKQIDSLEQLLSIQDMSALKNSNGDISSVVKPILAKETKRAGHLRMAVINKNGQAIYDNGETLDLKDSGFFKKAINGEEVVTDPLNSGSNSITMTYAVPIKIDNEIIGVLIAVRDGYELSDLAKNITYGKTGEAFIINDQSKTIAHADKDLITKILKSSTKNVDATSSATISDKDAAAKNTVIKNTTDSFGFSNFTELGKQMAAGKTGFGEYKFNGIPKYMGFSPISNSKWSIAIEINKDEVLEGLTALKIEFINTAIIFLVISFLVGYLIAKNISNPIIFITKASNEMANGNFTFLIEEKYTNRKDEIGKLATSFHKIKINVSEIIQSVIEEANNVSNSVENCTYSISDLNAMIQDVSAITDELSSGMENTASSTVEMNNSSLNIEKSANRIAERAQEGAVSANEISNKASELLNNFIKSQDNVTVVLSNTKERLTKALEDVKAIEYIESLSSAILGIASQTDLLALNANIEAARAGDAGRGFSVVAEEVRKLADNSKHTVTEIQNVTKEVINSVMNLSTHSNNMLEFVATDIDEDYKLMLDIMNRYSNDAEFVSSMIQDFSANSEEIYASIESMINEINGISLSTSEGSEGTRHIAEKLAIVIQKSNEVDENISHLKNGTNMLNKIISKFKI